MSSNLMTADFRITPSTFAMGRPTSSASGEPQPSTVNPRDATREIFLAGLAGVRPDRLIRRHLASLEIDSASTASLCVVGAGKAAGIMAQEVEALLGGRITAGHVVVKYRHACPLRHIQLTEAGHPTPDANSFRGAAEVLGLAEQAGERDVVLCLLSGGASALLSDCPAGIPPNEIVKLNELLVRCGADIAEMNAVRKHLSQIKGGQLARAAHPARVASLILSDVIGDPLDVIASGPTAPDTSTFQDAWAVLEKFNLDAEVGAAVRQHIKDGMAGRHPETPKPGDAVFQRVTNRIIGNIRTALEACQQKATELGFDTRIVDDALHGDAAAAAASVLKTVEVASCNTCLLFGGETTVKVAGSGTGGRNQHLALAAALQLESRPGITLLAAGTDGTDGPTDAAGAVVDSQTVPAARARGIDAEHCLRNFDSHRFFQQAGGQILTGPTLTNVMDVVIVLVTAGDTSTNSN
jgi:glycerate 2-kinase